MQKKFALFQNQNTHPSPAKPPYSFSEIANSLLILTDDAFDSYAFEREPLKGKIPPCLRLELAQKARQSGTELAKQLQQDYLNCSPSEICTAMGYNITNNSEPQHSFQIIYGQFVQPNQITLFSHCLKTVNSIAKQTKIPEFPSVEQLKQIILAHELYHALEEQTPNLFPRAYRLHLWKLGSFYNDSPVFCLSEIAGMAFAKQLCNLTFCPYALDALLLYGYNPQASCSIYEEIIELYKKP